MLPRMFVDDFGTRTEKMLFAKAEHKNTAQNLGQQYNVSPRPAMPAIEC